MKKRFGKLLLTAVMCTTLAVGCGGKQDEDVSNNDGMNQKEDINDVQPTGSEKEPGNSDEKTGDGEIEESGKEPGNGSGETDKAGEKPGIGGEETDENKEETGSGDGETDGNEEEPGSGDKETDENGGEEPKGDEEETTDDTKEPDGSDKEESGDSLGENVNMVTASDVQNLYVYGWNGSGVDFSKTDLAGWNDNDTTSPMIDANGNSVYHSADNWGNDAYLVFDFGEESMVGTVRMTTTNADVLTDSWAVYGGNQLSNAQSSWDVIMVSSEMRLSDNVIEIPVNGAYQYIMIGGHNADDFMNAWVHSWGYMTEIAFVESTASEGSTKESVPSGEDNAKEEKADDEEQNKEESGKDTETTAGSGIQLYLYGWNGAGVDFSKTDLAGWNDNDTTSPMTDANGNSVYHSADNWGSDTYLVFDFGAGRAIRTMKMATINNDILADSWAVYGGNQLSNAQSSWDVIMLSSQMQLSDGMIEVPVNETYQYIMIGGYNADDFMNVWVHSWDYMTEITFEE